MMKELTCILRTGALGLSLAFLPFAAPAPLAAPAFAAHHLDWDAMDEDEFYERLGNLSGEAVMAVMEDEDLDDPDIVSDVEGEIWDRAEAAGCDHLLDDDLVEALAKQAVQIAWEEFPSGSLYDDDEDFDDEDDDDEYYDDEEDCADGSCGGDYDDEYYDDDDDEYYDDDDDEYYDDDDDAYYDDDEDDGGADSGDYADYAVSVLDLVNENRASYGLAPLTLASDLCDDADIRAEEIVSLFSHTRPDGSSCFTVIDGSYRRVAENIAAGLATPEETVDQWMNSPGHRANILDPELRELGVGYCYEDGSAYGHYWVQLFRTR
ncbi:CAP domain-containing protein [Selenomonas sp.]|uniref:CAP domain-containing protein n=1 Tax=Selenomonas sp. TaxID=2053611 RepID=UPI002A76397F|nr:CAP domain-containing protein [Selenomonas sp.]MDY3298898.1 CAP domain-containing protein [Selenomonas sp.]